LQVKIKKLHPDAVIPAYAKAGDAGMDLTAITNTIDFFTGVIEYKTGLSIEIPEGYVGLIFPRSSIYKKNLTLCNSVGVIDSGYRGEITFKFRPAVLPISVDQEYNIGDRIGQLVIIPYPQIELVESEELSETERNTGGYGSTGQ